MHVRLSWAWNDRLCRRSCGGGHCGDRGGLFDAEDLVVDIAGHQVDLTDDIAQPLRSV